jgi:hypothetical protein
MAADRRRKAVLQLVLAGVVILSLAAIAWMVTAGLSASAALADIIALFVALVTFVLEIFWNLRPSGPPLSAAELADDLAEAVENQWLDEARVRRLRDPGVLPITWSGTDREVGDNPAAIIGRAGEGTVRDSQGTSADGDDIVALWDAASGRRLNGTTGLSGGEDMLFSPYGEFLAVAGTDDTVRLWSTRTGDLLATLVGHTGNVAHMAFSSDNRTLATGSWDGTVRLWDLSKWETGQRLCPSPTGPAPRDC